MTTADYLEIARNIDSELRRIGLTISPNNWYPGEPEEDSVVLFRFGSDADRQMFAGFVQSSLFVCTPNDDWVVVFPPELTELLSQLRAVRTLA